MKRRICVLMFFVATFNFIFGQSVRLKKGEPVQIGSTSGFTVNEENIIGILNGKAVYTYDKAGKTFLFDGQKEIDADGITEIHIYNEKILVYKKVQIAADGHPETYIFNGKTLQGPYGVDFENHRGTMPMSLSVTDNVFQNPLVSGLILVDDILAYEVDEYQFDPATPYEKVWTVPARLINRWIIKGDEKISIDLFGNFASYADSKNKKIAYSYLTDSNSDKKSYFVVESANSKKSVFSSAKKTNPSAKQNKNVGAQKEMPSKNQAANNNQNQKLNQNAEPSTTLENQDDSEIKNEMNSENQDSSTLEDSDSAKIPEENSEQKSDSQAEPSAEPVSNAEDIGNASTDIKDELASEFFGENAPQNASQEETPILGEDSPLTDSATEPPLSETDQPKNIDEVAEIDLEKSSDDEPTEENEFSNEEENLVDDETPQEIAYETGNVAVKKYGPYENTRIGLNRLNENMYTWFMDDGRFAYCAVLNGKQGIYIEGNLIFNFDKFISEGTVYSDIEKNLVVAWLVISSGKQYLLTENQVFGPYDYVGGEKVSAAYAPASKKLFWALKKADGIHLYSCDYGIKNPNIEETLIKDSLSQIAVFPSQDGKNVAVKGFAIANDDVSEYLIVNGKKYGPYDTRNDFELCTTLDSELNADYVYKLNEQSGEVRYYVENGKIYAVLE